MSERGLDPHMRNQTKNIYRISTFLLRGFIRFIINLLLYLIYLLFKGNRSILIVMSERGLDPHVRNQTKNIHRMSRFFTYNPLLKLNC